MGLVLILGPAWAQESASHKLGEHVFNAGGRPAEGVVPASPGFRVTLDAVGEGLVAHGLSSASFRMDLGFSAAYLPPGEVGQLVFTAKDTLAWSPERSAGTYNLYRDSHRNLAGLGFGHCEELDLAAATAGDADSPVAGDGYFYLVTVRNRLREEGTKGSRSNGDERLGSVCP